jgi:hypothetical protein
MKRKQLRSHRPQASQLKSGMPSRSRLRDWKTMLPVAMLVLLFLLLGSHLHLDHKVLAGVALIVGLVSGLFVWLLGLIGLLPLIGPIIVKVLSFGFIWLLNALGYLVSYVAIRRGYSQDVLTYRGLTIALIVGIIIGYVVAQFI